MIGYYIHHRGAGHLHRASAIAAQLHDDVVALSSLAPPADLGPFADWILLDHDDRSGDFDATAGGTLHWAPLRSEGYQVRAAQVASWVAQAAPRAVVVDLSVEIAALVRLMGVSVVVMASPGIRDDAAHQLGYRLASAVVAPWPERLYRPAFLEPHRLRTEFVGAISRFDALSAESPPGCRNVLVLNGAGGSTFSATQVASAAAATPGWTWTSRGVSDGDWSNDIWLRLQDCDLVVSHAGQNAVAEIAAARRGAVLIPQDRPHAEQAATAGVLTDAGLVLAEPGWPTAARWPDLLSAAGRIDVAGWTVWNDRQGAARAAAVIARVSRDA